MPCGSTQLALFIGCRLQKRLSFSHFFSFRGLHLFSSSSSSSSFSYSFSLSHLSACFPHIRRNLPFQKKSSSNQIIQQTSPHSRTISSAHQNNCASCRQFSFRSLVSCLSAESSWGRKTRARHAFTHYELWTVHELWRDWNAHQPASFVHKKKH